MGIEAQRMRASEDWPHWPLLPVKRYAKDGEFPEIGFVLYTGNVTESVAIYEGNMHWFHQAVRVDGVQAVLARLKNRLYDDAEAAEADGWVVD